VYAAITRRRAPSWATRSARDSTSPPRSPTPTRLCAPVRGANSMPERPWPFAVWGLDIVGPLRKVPRGYTHLLVAIDKFSKWVEVCPITNLRSE
jgi:hypothetical protein